MGVALLRAAAGAVWALAVGGLIVSCGNSGGTGQGDAATAADSPTDASARGDVSGTSGDTADAASANTDAPVADVARNPKCGTFDDKTYGKKVPWAGKQVGAKVFTCNTCRGGDPVMQGKWRQIDFATEDPATPMGAEKDLLTIDGNTFRERLADKVGEVELEGWYFCTDGAEFPSTDQVWTIDKVAPDGGGGNKVGDVLRISALKKGADLLALILYDTFDGKTTKTYIYCRVGSTIKGSPCKDPYAP